MKFKYFNNLNFNKSEYLFILFILFFTTIVSKLIFFGSHWDLLIPLSYSGDSQLSLIMIKRVLFEGWYFNSSHQGVPFNSEFLDFPGSDSFLFLIIKMIGKIYPNPAKTLNLFFILSFPANAIISYIIFRKINISQVFSLVGAISFTFLPFHFLRFNHILYTWYLVVPIFIWYSFKLIDNFPPFFEKSSSLFYKSFLFIKFIILSSFGVYFSFFGTIILLSCGLLGSIYHKSYKNFISSIILTSIISFGLFLNMIPNIQYTKTHGKNSEIAARHPNESEVYGMKIVQFFIPHVYHRNQTFHRVATNYFQDMPLVNENNMASLGIIGSVGLIYLFFIIVFSAYLKIEERIKKLSFITIMLILFSTIGGFSSLFSMFITPMIRAWNRSSIFVAFAAIAAAMILLDRLKTKKLASYIIAALIIPFILWDQTGDNRNSREQSINVYKSDERFIQEIEKNVSENSKIYQLPYMPFPESLPVNELADYQLAKGFIHSKSLMWSYGTPKGREGDLFYRNLSIKSISDQVTFLKENNFAGIYIDRRGYKDKGQIIESEILNLSKSKYKLVSDDNNLVFIKL